MQTTSAKKGSRTANAVLLIISVVMSLCLGEVAARLLVKKPKVPNVFVHQKSDNIRLLYQPIPGMKTKAYQVINTINHSGFRGKDVSLEKRPGEMRIAFLGDSVVYGYGVRDEKTLPAQLEESFKKRNQNIQVLNWGVSGYESDQQVEFLKEVGLKFEPDIVLLGYTLNDSRYASWELDVFNDIPDAKIRNTKANAFRRFLGYAYSHSRLLHLLDKTFRIQKKVKQLRSDELPIRWHLESKYNKLKDLPESEYYQIKKKVIEEASRVGTSQDTLQRSLDLLGFACESFQFYCSHWELSHQAFVELKQLSEKHHFKVVAVIFPYLKEMERYALKPAHDFVAKKFNDLGFEIIDLLEPAKMLYQQNGASSLTSDSLHFNRKGSPQIADYLHGELLRRKIVNLNSN